MNESFLWRPETHPYPLHLIGLSIYDVMMWLALGSGTLVWVLASRKWHLPWWQVLLSVIGIGVVGTLFTRVLHIVFWSFETYMKLPRLFFTIFEGGHSVQGSIVGFIVFAVVFSRWMRLPLREVSDALAWWPPLGLMFVRIGNFWGSEIVGTPTSLPWAVRFFYTPDHGVIPRHPVQLYESAFCFLLLLSMLAVHLLGARKRPFALSAIVLVTYPMARFLFDFIKETRQFVDGFPLSTGQVISLPLLALGVWLTAVAVRGTNRSL